jgi:signal peptidase I
VGARRSAVNSGGGRIGCLFFFDGGGVAFFPSMSATADARWAASIGGRERPGRLRRDDERVEFDMSEPVSLQGDEFGVVLKRSRRGGLATIFMFALAILVLFGLRIFLFELFNIPSGSLIPTLLNGDYVIVSKYPYGYSHFSLPSILDIAPEALSGRLFGAAPRRGDVVVFKLPRDGKTDYIKRVIGLPGDKIQMIHGRLSINGTIVERTPLSPYWTIGHFGRPADVAHYEETLPGGVKHEIIEMDGDEGYWDNTPVYEVPLGNYFMMGDNRDNSTDSRVAAAQQGVGFVPFDNLLGRAEMVVFSLDDSETARAESILPWSVRWNRLFLPVK